LKKKGVLIFSEGFSDLGTPKAIAKNLKLLVIDGLLMRIARGI